MGKLKTQKTLPGIDLVEVCRMGLLTEFVEQYIASCGAEDAGEKSKGNAKKQASEKGNTKFPNIAGFCRYCGVGFSELERLSEAFPDEYGALCSVFEDEALNSDVAVTLLGTYMKTRLGYAAKSGERENGDEGDVPIAVFDHDIFEDGE